MKKGSIKDLYKRAYESLELFLLCKNHEDYMIYDEDVKCLSIITGHTEQFIRNKLYLQYKKRNESHEI